MIYYVLTIDCIIHIHAVFQNESHELNVINIPKAQAESCSSLPISGTKSIKETVIGLPNKMVCLFVHTICKR